MSGKSNWSPISSATTFTLLASWVCKIKGCRKILKNESLVYVPYKFRMSVATKIADDFPFPTFPPISFHFPSSTSRASFLTNFGKLLLAQTYTITLSPWGGWAWSRCRPKKEDWLPKKERNQRTPGRRRSQEDSATIGELL